MMKRILTALALVAVSLAACGGVDKDATADNLIEELERLGTTFTSDQKECIKEAITSYSDDELRALSENGASDELSADFSTKLVDCVG